MPARIELNIPQRLLARYRAGLVTVDDMAAKFGVSTGTVLRNLHALGVDTSMRTRKREQFARKVEAERKLPAGTAYTAIAARYRRGESLRTVGAQLGVNPAAAARIIARQGLDRRPQWCREVFRGPKGERLDLAPFASQLTKLREGRGWTQKRLAFECDLSPSVIGVWEAGKKGPTWPTLAKLAKGLGVGYDVLGVPQSPSSPSSGRGQPKARRGP